MVVPVESSPGFRLRWPLLSSCCSYLRTERVAFRPDLSVLNKSLYGCSCSEGESGNGGENCGAGSHGVGAIFDDVGNGTTSASLGGIVPSSVLGIALSLGLGSCWRNGVSFRGRPFELEGGTHYFDLLCVGGGKDD